MVSEVADVRAFVAEHPPFDQLTAEQLEVACSQMLTAYSRSGELIPLSGEGQQHVSGLIMLRAGSMELRSVDDALIDRLGAGDYLVPGNILQQAQDVNHVTVLEDSLYYELPSSVLGELRSQNAAFDDLLGLVTPHLRVATGSRRVGASDPDDAGFYPDRTVADLMAHRVVFTDADTTVQQAATMMRDNAIASLMVEKDDVLVGILTDRDLRNRVLAAGLDAQTRIADVMTPSPMCISPSSSVSEAQLVMMSECISHLPVVDGASTVGMLSLSDILRASNAEPLPLIHGIHYSGDREALRSHTAEIPELITRLIERDTRPVEIGRILTTFSDAITCRLLSLAEAELGEAPCAYSWLAFGSQARREQVLGSDQDNALLLDDSVTAEQMPYFEQLAVFVNDGLDACGMPYCPGGIMAKNPKWCIPLSAWKQKFADWIEQPSPEALMHASIFFDMRLISGSKEMFDSLHESVLDKAAANTIFHAMMNTNALQHRPPLGFFKRFVLETDGDHVNSLELKKRGTIPIVDIARNCSLASGIDRVNTIRRLQGLRDAGELSAELTQSLIDAHEFIAGIRLEAQAREIRAGSRPDNHIDPDTLSPLLRHQLKEAFSVVREAQEAMSARFGVGAL